MKQWGIPLSIEDFINLTEEYASSLGKGNIFPSESPTYDWLRSFLQRHKNLSLKKARPLTKKRASLTPEQVDTWFNLLEKIIQDNNLENRPGQIFNSDETGEYN